MQNTTLFQVFCAYPEGVARRGGLKGRQQAVKYAAKLDPSLMPEVRTLEGRIVWMRTSTGAAVDLEAPDAFKVLEGLTPARKPEAQLKPKPFVPRPQSLASQCKAQPKARPTWAQLEASARQAELDAQARSLRYAHFQR